MEVLDAVSTPRILGFLFDDDNEEKFAVHGLAALQIQQVLENDHVVVRNRKRRRGLYLIIGRDNGGACLAVPITATRDPTIWRPVTAWPCKDREREVLDR